jgi:hypothetical protein
MRCRVRPYLPKKARINTTSGQNCKVGRDSTQFKVLYDLLKDVPRLIPEEHREVLRFFLEVKPVYDLQLVEDKVF